MTSCTTEQEAGLQPAQTSNGAVHVVLMFEKDGCKIWRFTDPQSGRYVYWSDCRGQLSQTYTEQVGKQQDEVHTQTIITK